MRNVIWSILWGILVLGSIVFYSYSIYKNAHYSDTGSCQSAVSADKNKDEVDCNNMSQELKEKTNNQISIEQNVDINAVTVKIDASKVNSFDFKGAFENGVTKLNEFVNKVTEDNSGRLEDLAINGERKMLVPDEKCGNILSSTLNSIKTVIDETKKSVIHDSDDLKSTVSENKTNE